MIRSAQSEDVEPITALIRAAYEGYVPLLGREPQPMTDDYGALIEAGEVHVLEEEGTIIGVLVAQQPEPFDFLIRTIAIAPSHQRRGLGSRLVDYAEHVADEEMVRNVRLYTNEAMEGTARLYERLGFVETRREGPEGKQVIYMTKQIPQLRTSWYETIVTDDSVCFGKVRIRGTRHYIDHLLGMIEGGASFDDILDGYPDLTREQLKAMMGFVRDVVAAKRNALKSEHKDV